MTGLTIDRGPFPAPSGFELIDGTARPILPTLRCHPTHPLGMPPERPSSRHGADGRRGRGGAGGLVNLLAGPSSEGGDFIVDGMDDATAFFEAIMADLEG